MCTETNVSVDLYTHTLIRIDMEGLVLGIMLCYYMCMVPGAFYSRIAVPHLYLYWGEKTQLAVANGWGTKVRPLP